MTSHYPQRLKKSTMTSPFLMWLSQLPGETATVHCGAHNVGEVLGYGAHPENRSSGIFWRFPGWNMLRVWGSVPSNSELDEIWWNWPKLANIGQLWLGPGWWAYDDVDICWYIFIISPSHGWFMGWFSRCHQNLVKRSTVDCCFRI